MCLFFCLCFEFNIPPAASSTYVVGALKKHLHNMFIWQNKTNQPKLSPWLHPHPCTFTPCYLVIQPLLSKTNFPVPVDKDHHLSIYGNWSEETFAGENGTKHKITINDLYTLTKRNNLGPMAMLLQYLNPFWIHTTPH